MIASEFNVRVEPVFRFPICTCHMNVHSWFFSREEKEPILFESEYGRGHRLPGLPGLRTAGESPPGGLETLFVEGHGGNRGLGPCQ
jgi:hypothetical protein